MHGWFDSYSPGQDILSSLTASYLNHRIRDKLVESSQICFGSALGV